MSEKKKDVSGNQGKSAKTETIRYEENPFVKDLVIPVKNKQIKISRFGTKENNEVLIHQITGEAVGTAVIAYKKVDNKKFVKLFTDNIKLTFGLTAAGQKTLYLVISLLQETRNINNDLITIDTLEHSRFLQQYPELEDTFSITTFRRGLSELVKSSILAMSKRKGAYFINPNFAFNGDRIAFTTILEKDKGEKTDEEDT